MLALWQTDNNSLKTILQTTPAGRLAFENEDMFFRSRPMHMFISINFVGSSFTENLVGFLKRKFACPFKILVPIVDMLTILL